MKKRKKTLYILVDQIKPRSKKNINMSNWGEKIFLALGWIALSPFVIKEYVILGFKWVVKKIKRK
tara:strand:+ start:207 stop:401 length:195 start_codon:yes stop_codon:yes gene_type:complete